MAYVLSEAADEGHVYLPSTELVQRAGEMLGVTPELVTEGIATLAEDAQVRVEESGDRSQGTGVRGQRSGTGAGTALLAEDRPVYLIPFYYGEVGVANRLRRLAEATEDRLSVFQHFDWTQAFALLQNQSRVALTPDRWRRSRPR